VVEEKRFDKRLQHVDEVIMPAHVSELVGKHNIEVRRSQTGDHTHRKQDDRSQAPNDGRHADETGLEDPYGPVDAEALCERLHSSNDRRINRSSRSLQPLDTCTGNDEADRQQEHACKPDGDGRGQQSIEWHRRHDVD
jgi:hypothetical protein